MHYDQICNLHYLLQYALTTGLWKITNYNRSVFTETTIEARSDLDQQRYWSGR